MMVLRARREWASIATFVAMTSFAGSAVAADYGAKGPETFTTTNLAPGSTGATGGKLVVPNGAGPYPIIVASHGFSASSANQLGWAEHFASYGFVVAVPDFPGGFAPDHVKNGATVEALVAEVARTVPKADATRVGLEGHSAGGLATTLAAAKIEPGAVVLFDPVDANGVGKTAFGALCSPTLVLFADAGQCNKSAEWKGFGPSTKGPLALANVVGASHCDGENAARGLCSAPIVGCGAAAAPARQTVHARYATAHFLARLKGDTAAASALALAALTADAELAGASVKDGPLCAPRPSGDGGAPADAGPRPPSVVDASGGGGPPVPTASPTGTAPATGEPSANEADQSGCAVGAGAGATGVGSLLVGMSALVFALRRRRSRRG